MDKMLIIGYNEILEYEHFIIESGWNMKFEDLKLEKQLLKALAEEGYKKTFSYSGAGNPASS